nr:MAG TPA: hypothetical protein [Caudoviricetes sp.]
MSISPYFHLLFKAFLNLMPILYTSVFLKSTLNFSFSDLFFRNMFIYTEEVL